jgi:hypothetical protein
MFISGAMIIIKQSIEKFAETFVMSQHKYWLMDTMLFTKFMSYSFTRHIFPGIDDEKVSKCY